MNKNTRKSELYLSNEPDQIDQMSEDELRTELRSALERCSQLKTMTVDLKATLKTIYNSSTTMLDQYEQDRRIIYGDARKPTD